MFQSAWFIRKNDSKHTIDNKLPSEFITKDKIKYVRTLYWDEHCLECSAPACYNTCSLYKPRKDQACMRLEYGIRCMNHKVLLWDSEMKFRSWGKLEARINKGTLSVQDINKMDKIDRMFTGIFKWLSAMFFKKEYSLSTKWDGLKRRKYATIKSKSQFVNDFLFQCYYKEDESFNLIFEIADRENKTIYKTNFRVKKGFNQEIMRFDFGLPEGGLVRIFPENDFTAELHVFAADFVELFDTVSNVPNKKVKCVAWDLDNTVWNGILIETNPDKLMLRESVKEVMDVLDKRGVIQIVVSKNDRECVIPVLDRLGINDYFVCIFANWDAKSTNIFQASRMLNINVDTFALIDDSEFERNEVKYTLPCVRVYTEKQLQRLLALPEFDLPITDESSCRRLSYQQEVGRKEIKLQFGGNNTDFIKSCNLQIKIEPLKTELQRSRSLELIQRTNQLNLSAKRYTEAEFDVLLKDKNITSLVVYAEDKFGDYGQVAYLCFEIKDNLIISEFVMSCRVAAKYVENALFGILQKKYQKNIEMLGRKTGRNSVLLSALKKTGFDDEGDDNIIKLRLSLSQKISEGDIVSAYFCDE